MSVLSDRWIKKMALEKEMIKPFMFLNKNEAKAISYGYLHLVMMLEFLMSLKYLQM